MYHIDICLEKNIVLELPSNGNDIIMITDLYKYLLSRDWKQKWKQVSAIDKSLNLDISRIKIQ